MKNSVTELEEPSLASFVILEICLLRRGKKLKV